MCRLLHRLPNRALHQQIRLFGHQGYACSLQLHHSQLKLGVHTQYCAVSLAALQGPSGSQLLNAEPTQPIPY
jgi:hypothetical protein